MLLCSSGTFFLQLSGDGFQHDHQSKTEHREPDGGHDAGVELFRQDVAEFIRPLPRPHLAERAAHETDQQCNGEVVIFAEEPAQQPYEGGDADDDAAEEDAERQQVRHEIGSAFQVVNRSKHMFIFPHQNKDERTGDTGENHRADGDRAADGDVPEAVGRILKQRKSDDDPGADRADECGDDTSGGPFGDPAEHGEDRSDHQPEEERPDLGGPVFEHPLDVGGEQKNRAADAEAEREQKGPRKRPERLCDAEGDRHLDGGWRGEGADRFDQLLINAEDKRHSSAGDAGDDIGGSHDEPGAINTQIVFDRPPGSGRFPTFFLHRNSTGQPFCGRLIFSGDNAGKAAPKRPAPDHILETIIYPGNCRMQSRIEKSQYSF